MSREYIKRYKEIVHCSASERTSRCAASMTLLHRATTEANPRPTSMQTDADYVDLQEHQRWGKDQYQSAQDGADTRLINGLGWFSIGLGLGELLAPGSIARLVGVRDEGRVRKVLRTYGVREIAAGIGILSQPRTAGWMWGRVAGDLMDLAVLGTALGSRDANRARVATAAAAVLGVTAVDIICGTQLSNPRVAENTRKAPEKIVRTILIDRSPDELYQFWRDLNNAPKFMGGVESVTQSDGRSHWRMRIPGGKTVEWDAEIVEDAPNYMLSWRAAGDAGAGHSGTVRFERRPGGLGTLVRVEMRHGDSGLIGSLLSRFSGPALELKIENDLRRFKQLVETGEVMRSDASIHDGMHPARPPAGFAEPAAAQWPVGYPATGSAQQEF